MATGHQIIEAMERLRQELECIRNVLLHIHQTLLTRR
jgi:hypothetical protein